MNAQELIERINGFGEKFKFAQVRVVEQNLIFCLKPENVYLDETGQICIDIEQNMLKDFRQGKVEAAPEKVTAKADDGKIMSIKITAESYRVHRDWLPSHKVQTLLDNYVEVKFLEPVSVDLVRGYVDARILEAAEEGGM